MVQQRHRVELPDIVENAFQNARRRVKASRVDFYSGYIAALEGQRITSTTARQLIAQYDQFDLGDEEDDE